MSLADLNVPEVDYNRTALRTVVCQLRFNTILRIGQELPVEFQDRVRDEFPQFLQQASTGFKFSSSGIEIAPITAPVWRFQSEDEQWSAALGPDSVSLETKNYANFADFAQRFKVVLDALIESTERISHFTRVGLRYINAFSPIDFPGGWSHRFKPYITGPLADPVLGSDVAAIQNAFILADAEGSVTFRYGVNPEGEFLLDTDCYVDSNVAVAAAEASLENFNRRAYQLFRWSISDDLHQEMEPTTRG